MRFDALTWLGALLLLMTLVGGTGCSASTASDEASEAPEAGVQAADPGAAAEAAVIDPEPEEGEKLTGRCHGILNCTFFGVGAVIAAPFWVLGAVLGLVF